MAGHSKWSNIKRKKEKTDAKSKGWPKVTREIIVATKAGGGGSGSKLPTAAGKSKRRKRG